MFHRRLHILNIWKIHNNERNIQFTSEEGFAQISHSTVNWQSCTLLILQNIIKKDLTLRKQNELRKCKANDEYLDANKLYWKQKKPICPFACFWDNLVTSISSASKFHNDPGPRVVFSSQFCLLLLLALVWQSGFGLGKGPTKFPRQ